MERILSFRLETKGLLFRDPRLQGNVGAIMIKIGFWGFLIRIMV